MNTNSSCSRHECSPGYLDLLLGTCPPGIRCDHVTFWVREIEWKWQRSIPGQNLLGMVGVRVPHSLLPALVDSEASYWKAGTIRWWTLCHSVSWNICEDSAPCWSPLDTVGMKNKCFKPLRFLWLVVTTT